MRRISLLVFVVGLMGCKAPLEEPQTGILFSIAETEVSKTDALTQGDEIGVFASIEGTERYFLDNTKYIVGSDGRSLSTSPVVYYPEAKQAINFYAYLPFGGTWDGGVGTFSVPSDQTTVAALKQADLCWAKASSTPVATPVALEFAHKMARLLITTNEPTTKIAISNAFLGGTLDIKTGAFTNTLRSEVFTTGTELILPAQTVTRLVLTVSGIEYVFEGSISLETAKTTSISLTFNPTTKTATLSGSSTTDWTGSSSQGNTTQSVSNVLKMHWVSNVHNRSAEVNKIVLKIKDHTSNTTADYTVYDGFTYANDQFTVPFSSLNLNYPYTIETIGFYCSNELLQSCNLLVGNVIYKSGLSTIGIKDQANAVLINGLWWATGNLVAVSKENNSECKVGAPGDGGLYFQFGSLIGWKGGNQANGGTGVGMPQAPLTSNGTYWNGSGFTWASDAMVWPSAMTATPTSWPQGATTNQWYFGLQTGWSTPGQNIRDYSGFSAGDLADKGVGDPCTYYLGGTWRMPTTTEYVTLCNNQVGGWLSWAAVGGSWATSPTNGGNLQGTKLFFPASGNKNTSNGSFHTVTTSGTYWSSSVGNATYGYHLNFYQPSGVIPQGNSTRSYGFPVRCVKPGPTVPNPPAESDYVTIGALKWAKGNLVAINEYNAKVGKPSDGGLYFQFGSLIGWKGGNQANGGTGVGMPQAPLTSNGTYWNGSFSWSNDAMVWPSEMTKTPTSWPNNNGSSADDRNTVVDQWFFNYNVAPYSTPGQDIRGFLGSFTGDTGSGTLGTGRYAKWGVGDPCSYYLGGTWRLPTGAEYAAMCNNQSGINGNYSWAAVGGSWVTSPVAGGNLQGTKLFFPASGHRDYSTGSFYYVTTGGYGWSSSVYNATGGLYLFFNSSWVHPQTSSTRSNGFPVRCVSE